MTINTWWWWLITYTNHHQLSIIATFKHYLLFGKCPIFCHIFKFLRQSIDYFSKKIYTHITCRSIHALWVLVGWEEDHCGILSWFCYWRLWYFTPWGFQPGSGMIGKFYVRVCCQSHFITLVLGWSQIEFCNKLKSENFRM